jgi:hypothetical protein
MAMDRSRGALRRKSPASAVAEWRGLVDARWTLVDEFRENGRRYVVARENRSEAPDFERLTERELQVVAFASLGHSNKLIAYELGIATSTAECSFRAPWGSSGSPPARPWWRPSSSTVGGLRAPDARGACYRHRARSSRLTPLPLPARFWSTRQKAFP